MLIRPRFTFFSDAFVEARGWYIDDAGIEVDLFKPSGHWTSPVFEATGPRWGQLSMDGRVPPGTEVRATILSDGLPLSGFINRTLPLDLSSLDVMEHDAIRVGLDLSTLDPLITPSIRRLTLGAFVRVDASGVSGDTGLLGAEGLVSNGSGALVLDGTTSTGRIEGHWAAPAPYEDVTVTCGCMQARTLLTADDGTVASATFNSPGNQSLTLPLSQVVDVDVLIFSGGSLSNLSIDPVTLGGALLAEVRVGDALSWGWSGADSMGAFGHQTITIGNASHPVVLLPEEARRFSPYSPSSMGHHQLLPWFRTRRSRRSLIPVGITDYDIMSFNWLLKVRTFTSLGCLEHLADRHDECHVPHLPCKGTSRPTRRGRFRFP